MPTKYRKLKNTLWPKGVSNRNAGLDWIIQNANETGDDSGVLYFADDDNTYDLRLFEEVILLPLLKTYVNCQFPDASLNCFS
jgi:hypothetical protein